MAHQREARFWNNSFVNVRMPCLQKPHFPIKPPTHPKVSCNSLETYNRIHLDFDVLADVVFVVGGEKIPAHCCFLVAASAIFEKLFVGCTDKDVAGNNISNHLLLCSKCRGKFKEHNSNQGSKTLDKESISSIVPKSSKEYPSLASSQKAATSAAAEPFSKLELAVGAICKYNCEASNFHLVENDCIPEAFVSVETMQDEVGGKKFIVTLDETITPTEFKIILVYLYGGIAQPVSKEGQDVIRAASMMGLSDLGALSFHEYSQGCVDCEEDEQRFIYQSFDGVMEMKAEYRNAMITQNNFFILARSTRIWKFFVQQNILSGKDEYENGISYCFFSNIFNFLGCTSFSS